MAEMEQAEMFLSPVFLMAGQVYRMPRKIKITQNMKHMVQKTTQLQIRMLIFVNRNENNSKIRSYERRPCHHEDGGAPRGKERRTS